MKATVYRISGAVVSSNYIQLPKATSQSLALTGRYLYLLFRPLPSKFFSIHLEVATTAGIAVRVSISNIFKEFKSTLTWLQYPYSLLRHEEPESRGGVGERGREAGRAKRKSSSRWTLLVLDLRAILGQQLHVEFAYLKNIQLCANLLVRGVFTSHAEYSPLPERDSAHLEPLPREMRFPLGKTEEFAEVYDYVRFPLSGGDERLIEVRELERERDCRTGVGGEGVNGAVGEGGRMTRKSEDIRGSKRPRVSLGFSLRVVIFVSFQLARGGEASRRGGGGRSKGVRERSGRSEGVRDRGGRSEGVRSGVHVYVERGAEVNLLRGGDETSDDEEDISTNTDLEAASRLEQNSVHLPSHSVPPTLKVHTHYDLIEAIGVRKKMLWIACQLDRTSNLTP